MPSIHWAGHTRPQLRQPRPELDPALGERELGEGVYSCRGEVAVAELLAPTGQPQVPVLDGHVVRRVVLLLVVALAGQGLGVPANVDQGADDAVRGAGARAYPTVAAQGLGHAKGPPENRRTL